MTGDSTGQPYPDSYCVKRNVSSYQRGWHCGTMFWASPFTFFALRSGFGGDSGGAFGVGRPSSLHCPRLAERSARRLLLHRRRRSVSTCDEHCSTAAAGCQSFERTTPAATWACQRSDDSGARSPGGRAYACLLSFSLLNTRPGMRESYRRQRAPVSSRIILDTGAHGGLYSSLTAYQSRSTSSAFRRAFHLLSALFIVFRRFTSLFIVRAFN
jgi:hypothetical protein